MQRALYLLVVIGAGGCFNPSASDSGDPATSTVSTSGTAGTAETLETTAEPPGPTTSIGPGSTTMVDTTAPASTATGSTTDDPATEAAETTAEPQPGCGMFTPGTDLNVCTATYLGAAGDDRAHAVIIAPSGAIHVAGLFPGHDFGANVVDGAGDGAVLQLTLDGAAVNTVTRFPSAVLDIDIERSVGRIAVAGAFGAAGLNGDGTIAWTASNFAAARVAIGEDGTTAAIDETQVHLLNSEGTPITIFSIPDVTLSDVALAPEPASVILTATRTGVPLMPCTFYSMPGLGAFAYDSTPLWQAYNFSAEQAAAAGVCGVSRAGRVNIGADGHVYYTGTSDAADSVHARDPLNIAFVAAANVATDPYNTPGNLDPLAQIGYYARFDAVNGKHLAGQFVLARDTEKSMPDAAKGTTLLPLEATAAADGRVFVAGDAAFALADRDMRTVDGMPVGAHIDNEPFVMVVSPDLKTRLAWSPFTAGGPGQVTGIHVGAQHAAMLASQTVAELTLGQLLTVDALQPEPGLLGEGYLAVFPILPD